MKSETDYGGQSLRFVRQLIRCPAKWPTAKAAAKVLPLNTEEPPTFGSVCFYAAEPWGHCGVYVNDGVCLTVNTDGQTRLLPFDDEHYWGGRFIGWTPADTFALYSGAK
jgi:hypothetical protein